MSDHSDTVGGLDVSRETFSKLRAYGDLIAKWTKKINLIAPTTVPNIWDRHIVDSAQVFKFAGPNWTSWIDLGSGGGLPGLVVAILDQNNRSISLIESDTRKCLFLKTVRRELDLKVNILNCRIEEADLPPSDVLSARALAPLPDLMAYSTQHLLPSGKAFFQKGARFQEDLDEATKNWQFECIAHPSLTNSDARVLEISGMNKREP